MKKLSLLLTTIGVIMVVALLLLKGQNAASQPSTEGRGWFPAGSDPKEYSMEIVTDVKHSGTKAGMIRYTASGKPSGFGTFMQMHEPGAWAGKKLKMTGYIKTQDVSEWCGMWCRIDGADGKEMVDFDNMQDRPIKGTTDWTKYEITVDITKDASAIAYGVLLDGKGTVYFDDVSFEVLGDAQPKPKSKHFTNKPANLDFEN